MKYRKLRIAFSAVCGVLCLLLIALWVRSYWWHDAFWIRLAANRITGVTYVNGSVGAGIGSSVFPEIVKRRFLFVSGKTDPFDPKPSWLEFRYIRYSESDMEVRIPFWFPVLFMATLAALPWLRFSLRRLLIATTLVAILLGLVVYAAS
jgi:hypothetical protein